jgi:ribose 5-phosphate isomerase A
LQENGMANLEHYKEQAAEHALAEVQSGMVLGLGSGSTARYLVLGLAARLHDGRLRDIVGVPTSDATAELARQHGVAVTTLDMQPALDLAMDGADEIDPHLNLIKGLGGALLREKIVACSARRFVIVADDTKIVTQLGERAPLPVEVVPFGQVLVERRLRELGAEPVLRQTSPGTPYLTDQGNIILDCRFASFVEPATLGVAVRAIPGVVEHGLFINMAAAAYVAGAQGVAIITRPATT